MKTEDLKKLKSDRVVDTRGTACHGSLQAVKQAIADVPDGGIMEILSSDEGTKSEVPGWAVESGYQYLGNFEESGYFTIYVKK